MIVTIDGPAGAGKSSAARSLARRIGFRFLDTGAMYRAVALAGLREGIDWTDPERITDLVHRIRIEVDDQSVRLDGQDVTEAIRTSQVLTVTRYVADHVEARRRLVELQRQIVSGGADFVTEGRDQGTVAFPHAECKIFLTATPEERARRRQRDLAARGEQVMLEEVLRRQTQRDTEDANRPVGALVPAADAVLVVTDGMTPEEVVAHLEYIVRQRQPSGRTAHAAEQTPWQEAEGQERGP